MTYVTSDLHGYPLDRFRDLLAQAGFSDSDELYVLGDVIDRNGDGGIEDLRWIIAQPNVHLLCGNHEDMLLNCDFLFFTPDIEVNREQVSKYRNWMWNGGKVTLDTLLGLLDTEPETVFGLLSFLEEAPLYRELTVNGRKYILTHAGLGSYAPDRPLEDYETHDLIWFRPSLNTSYDGGAKVIFGHTPTDLYGGEYEGRALRTETWTDIDTGAAHGGSPMLLRLEDEAEFYAAH